ncbi:MAG: NADH:ubiquinone reductase (Na(+)-transporting) subunit E [Candidatus Marinimicrobia bacterium]|jgi:Na+-transporting NADH:ubiquinone oxidoreductase subunit E|nr:NADH:ubiquinone reductase (Na(+)-transporting) subunit E [Candidatus Neomarinimicrobiota bacterium]|tara:strand:+ start:5096 stop:5722 length:627 start_codon:yes stop_codon:yes gene_type:complete
MELIVHYLSLATKSIFIENILLAYFLGMCSFLAISKNVEASKGMGKAVIFVNGLTVPLNWFINSYLLKDGALSWTGISVLGEVNLDFLRILCFIATIAALVQFVEMFIDKFSPTLYNSLGIFLPLITVNCSILGASLFMNERGYTFGESVVFGLSSGVGFYLAIVSMAAIRFKLRYSQIPEGLKGLGITMILTGLVSMAYLAFSGIQL